MSKLIALIDDYRDAHGQVSDASIARAVGVAPQTISSWRKRGIRNPPSADTMRRLADFIGVPYEDYLLQAVLVDTGFRESMPTLQEARQTEAERRRHHQVERGIG